MTWKQSVLRGLRFHWVYVIAPPLFFLLCLAVFFFDAPQDSEHYPQVFVVSEGETVREIATRLQEKQLINSKSLFIIANHINGGKILWGSYHFYKPKGVFFRAREMYLGEKNMPLRRIKVPERSNFYHLADLFDKEFNDFDRDTFEDLARDRHGYLYPDTYLFSEEEVTPEQVIDIMMRTFNRRTDDLFEAYDGPLSQDEIVALAAIVELEASRLDDRRLIAGVLFNRLEQDMRLEVDVPFIFIDGKDTFDLSLEDLQSDHPLNLYKNYGIPPIPIVNPSRDSIDAVINPTESNYLYFVGDGRRTYFSETYAEHLEKKRTYVDPYK